MLFCSAAACQSSAVVAGVLDVVFCPLTRCLFILCCMEGDSCVRLCRLHLLTTRSQRRRGVTGCVQAATPQRIPAIKMTANGSVRAVTQVRPNPWKMVSVCKYRHMAMHAQPPSSLHAIRPHNL
jgi:hypothetical protein